MFMGIDKLPKYISKDFLIKGSLIDLGDPDAAWLSIDKGVRTSIRKGEKMGVAIRPFRLDDPAELATVTSFTPNANDIPPQFTSRYHAFIAEAVESKEILGWILLVEIEKTLFMLCHASTPAGKERQTPNFLLWHAVKTYAGGPFHYLNVGASYRESLQNYFSHFRQREYPMVMRPPDLPVDLRITPFDTAAYSVAPADPDEGRALLNREFKTDEWTTFPRAMFAIAACLREYRDQGRLTSESEVLISTTTESPYVSSCVTKAIEDVCKWSRTPSDKTAAVFMIHEFGFPNPRAAEWRKFCDDRRIPLIEDLAYGWGSEGTGTWGDVRIYSATKLFPVQFGGFLVGIKIPFERVWNVHRCADPQKEEEILGTIKAHWQPLEEIREARQHVWKRYEQNLGWMLDPIVPDTGRPPRLDPSPLVTSDVTLPLRKGETSSLNGIMLGAVLLKTFDEDDMRRVSSFVRRFGIEVGNWYHHGAIFLPCHQRLSDRHVDYISGAVLACYREGCGIPGMRH